MNGGDWCVLLDEDGMLELSPVARVCAVPRGRWPGVFLDEDGLVVHRARAQSKPTFCGEGGPGHVRRRSISRWIKTFESACFTLSTLIFASPSPSPSSQLSPPIHSPPCCCTPTFLPTMRCSLMPSPCTFPALTQIFTPSHLSFFRSISLFQQAR